MDYRIIPVFLVFLIMLISCSTAKNEYSELGYEELPSDVRRKFKEIYNYQHPPKIQDKDTIWNSPPFAECYNLDNTCLCRIEVKGGLVRNPYFLIQSCGKYKYISWGILQRVFVIKKDSIYYPYSSSAMTTTGKPRSYNILIDTLKFRVEVMSNR